jgi:hypothetical protein
MAPEHEALEPGEVSTVAAILDALIELAFHRGYAAAREDDEEGI